MGRALLSLGEISASTIFDAAVEKAGGQAEEYFQRGIELFRELGNDAELAKGLERFGRHQLEKGRVEEGKALLEEARGIFERLGMKAGAAIAKVIGEI